MKKRLGLLSLFGVTALLVFLTGAITVMADDGVVPVPVPEVAAAEGGVALGSLNLTTVEAEGYAIAANGMTTRADIGAFSLGSVKSVNIEQSIYQGFQQSLWSALGQLNSPFIYTAAVLLALTMTMIIITDRLSGSPIPQLEGVTGVDASSVATGRMRTVPGVC